MTSSKIFVVLLLFISIMFFSCKKDYLADEVALSLELAGENSGELEVVLNHYSQNENDSLKLKAAKFLIANMKYYGSSEGDVIDEFNAYIDSVYLIKKEVYNEVDFYPSFRENAKYFGNSPMKTPDLKAITSDYLIKNIDQSFELWKKPYAQHLNFDDFAELILPYRLGDEVIENWRDMYSDRFSSLITDSVTTAFDACQIVNDSLNDYKIRIFNSSIAPSSIRPSSLLNIKFGLCGDYSSLALYAMRSLGIPVAEDLVICFGLASNAHEFNMVLNNDGTTHDFSGAEDRLDDHLKRFPGVPKVYRSTFGVQKESLAVNCEGEDIPRRLASPFMKDVTAEYDFLNATDIEVDFEQKGIKIAYLTVFGIDGWIAIDWGKPKRGRVKFEDIGPNLVYSVGYYQDGAIKTIGSPFLVKDDGSVEYFKADKQNLVSMSVRRKYPYYNSEKTIPPSIIGGEFQGSNSSTFNNAKLLHRIIEAPALEYITEEADSKERFKYLRYHAPDSSSLNMAEIEFYNTDGKKIEGKIIGIRDKSPHFPDSELEDAFDGDDITFLFTGRKGLWVGLELEEAVSVDKIRYIIRHGDNGVRKGQRYELLYAEEEHWISLGEQVAPQENFIVYDDVPEGALYWLRNLTKGNAERIFIIKDGEQIWY